MLKHTTIRPMIKVLNKADGLVEAVVSDETQDRDGDIIRVAGWDLKDFAAHPVMLAGHDYTRLKSHIGDWVEMAVIGDRLVGKGQYFVGKGNAEADWGFQLAQMGRAAFSVGFIPDMEKATPIDEAGDKLFGPWEFKGQKLLEASQVPMPSNPSALQAAKTLGGHHPVVAEIIDEMLADTPPESVLDASATADAIWAYIRTHLEDFRKQDIARMLDDQAEPKPRNSIQEAISRWAR